MARRRFISILPPDDFHDGAHRLAAALREMRQGGETRRVELFCPAH